MRDEYVLKRFGEVEIRVMIRNPQARLGFEKDLFPPGRVGLSGWQRAHAIGPGFGREHREGIFYAPASFNLSYQNQGIEKFIRGCFDELRPDCQLFVTVIAKPHSMTQRIASVHYKLEIKFNDSFNPIFEVGIEVENRLNNPRIITTMPILRGDLDQFLINKT